MPEPFSVEVLAGTEFEVSTGNTGRETVIVGVPGTQGSPGASNVVVVVHGADGAIVRPVAPVVYWIGVATPANALPRDLWYNA